MTRAYLISKAAILLARRIAGPERDEWVRAMAAEWDALEHGKAWWALGCLDAALRDRLRRESHFVAVMVLAVPVVIVCNSIVMNAAAPLLGKSQTSTTLWIAVFLLNPAIVPLVLGALYPDRATAIGFAAGLLYVLAPLLGSMVLFGVSGIEWVHFAVTGLGVSLLLEPLAVAAWTFAARLGARLRHRFSAA